MKSSMFMLRAVAALFSSATVLAVDLPTPTAATPSEELAIISQVTPAPQTIGADGFARLDLRQATTVDETATENTLQVPTVTTQWAESTINGVATYVEVIYTQTFAAVPDQWPSPIAGTIGLGTDSANNKRDAAPEATGNDFGIAGRIRRA